MAENPVLLITGASTGIGAKTAHHAAEAGYRLVLGARSEDKLEALASELGGPDKAIAVRCDVTEWEDCENLVKAATEAFGGFDAVFANAGFGASRGFLEESPEHWSSMILTNVLGVAYTIRATLPHLLEKETGHFVITSSVAGRRALPGLALLGDEVVGDGDGRGASPGAPPDARQHAHPRDADRAGDGRHAILRQPPRRARSRTRTSRERSCTRCRSPSMST